MSSATEAPAFGPGRSHWRLWALVAVAAAKVQSADFWDNSTLDGPELVAEMANGQLLAPPKWPSWAPDVLTEHWAA